MPIYENNPFTVLGISLDEAGHLASLSPSLRKRSLAHSRRYYASIYHTDITKNPADDAKLAGINRALDVLEVDKEFHIALQEYSRTGRVQVSAGASAAMYEQVKYFREIAEAETARADAAEKRLEQIDNRTIGQAETQKERINELTYETGNLQGTIERLRGRRTKETDLLLKHRQNILSKMISLHSALYSGNVPYVPKKMIGLDQVGDREYTIGAGRKRRILKVNQDLTVVQKGDTPLIAMGTERGVLLGGLRSLGRVKLSGDTLVNHRMKGYDSILFNLQPYLGKGVHPVVIIYGKYNPYPLYVHGEIIDIKPVEGE